MNDLLNKIEIKRQKLKVLLKNKDNLKVMQKWLKSELAYTSNAIEGNTLTRKETALAIEENITSGSKPINDYLEAINHANAYNFILNAINKKLPIDEKLVLEIHKKILSGIDNINAGFYRNVRVHISGSQTILPNPLKVPQLMDDFNKWLANNERQPLKAIDAHYKLVSIHPFVDGNGRTARLLMNLMLMMDDYAPMIIRPIDRKRYLSALEQYQTKNINEIYIRFMLNALSRSFNIVMDLLEKDVSTEKLLKISEFAKLAKVPVSTIRYWVEIGKLKPASYTQSGYMMFDKKQLKDLK